MIVIITSWTAVSEMVENVGNVVKIIYPFKMVLRLTFLGKITTSNAFSWFRPLSRTVSRSYLAWGTYLLSQVLYLGCQSRLNKNVSYNYWKTFMYSFSLLSLARQGAFIVWGLQIIHHLQEPTPYVCLLYKNVGMWIFLSVKFAISLLTSLGITQTHTIHRGVWYLPNKFHLNLIIKDCNMLMQVNNRRIKAIWCQHIFFTFLKPPRSVLITYCFKLS